MTDYTETVAEEGEYRVLLIADPESEGLSPRDADNVGIMWTRHPRYTLGDNDFAKHIPEWDELNEFIDRMLEWHGGREIDRAVLKHLKRAGATVVRPLYLYDHSGISISAGENLIERMVDTRAERRTHFVMDPGGWDTSYVGYIFDSPRTREVTGVTDVAAALASEVSEYNSYLTGDVWGIRVERKVKVHETVTDLAGEMLREEESDDWDEVDSCWGFIGHEYAEQEAREYLASHLS